MAATSTFLHALRAGLAPVVAGEHVLVAASGGVDSSALLAGVAALAGPAGWRVTAVHVDHGLRGAESDADRDRVHALAATLDVACVLRTAVVPPGSGIEVTARRARYRALSAVAQDIGATRILTAHTADDQAETVLLRLLRGGGRGGLGGIRPQRGRLLRPLLAATRADVRRYLTERGIVTGIDRSNADLRHTRNRLRRLAIPFLAAEFNPRLIPALAALAARLRDEDDVLAAAAASRATALVDARGLDTAVTSEPRALGRRIVRAWLEQGVRRGVTATHVERVLALASAMGRGTVALPGAFRVVRDGDRLVRRLGRQAAPGGFEVPITLPATVEDPAGAWVLQLSAPRNRRPEEPLPADAGHAMFDARALAPTLTVRSPRPGDRIHVARVGTRKLQDVLVDARVAREARSGVPMLVSDGTILWVAGIVRGSGASIEPATRQVIDAALVRKG
ncbi:MAG TPA: tRNA lysidine(34) synthetase TilS [Candidatus Binatia bacterium]|jgi:tRNA(Ile)-lysidine synthase|nr:tRNA lysidine(34) synthetase TilS [Candidatus Binatia bacterium]